ncbi:MAG: methyltransferase domain-containing protein [Chloroflexi bacterium]|nr:methyltransferase domain-containing protein [Chloroflexota bacterium]
MNQKITRTKENQSGSHRLYRLLTGDNGIVGTRNRQTREAWLEKTLQAIPAGQRILDAGAGELRYKNLCSHLHYVSQDFAQYTGEGDGIGLQTGTWDQTRLDIVSDITDIPVEEASFDAVMCIEVLEHVPDPISALRELTRVLRPGGVLIVTAPFASLTHYAPYFFQTGYSRYFYEYWLETMGYTIEDMQWNGNYFEFLAQELRRLPWASKEYADTAVPLHLRFILGLLLAWLEKPAKRSQGAEQLLSFGLHIKAKKQ